MKQDIPPRFEVPLILSHHLLRTDLVVPFICTALHFSAFLSICNDLCFTYYFLHTKRYMKSCNNTLVSVTWTNKRINGFVMVFSKSFLVFDELETSMDSTNSFVKWNRYPEATSSGRRTITHIQLNTSWITAAPKAFRNSSRDPAWASETIVLVTVVPMLEPMMIGIVCFTGMAIK